MSIEWLVAYLALGAFVGFFAGLLGVGGGGIMVPMLATLFAAQGFPHEHLVHLALGTSMAAIVMTSISSLRAHHKHGAVRWDIVKGVAPGVFVVADKTYFIAGGFPAQSVRAVLPYGGPEQQAGYRDDGGAHWMSARGIVSCTAGGELSNLQEAHVAISVEGSAATLMRESDGMHSIVAALTEQGNLGAGVGSYAQARIIRKETP